MVEIFIDNFMEREGEKGGGAVFSACGKQYRRQVCNLSGTERHL